MEVQKNSRQVPSIEKYTADKKYCDLLYGILQEMSYSETIGGVTIRYVNKNDFTFQSLGDKIGLKRVTASTKFKNLIGLGLIEEVPNEKRYKFKLRIIMNKEILIKLLKEENYPAHMVDATIAKLNKLQPIVLENFEVWLNEGKLPDFEVEGYSYQVLVNDYGMKPVGAFLTLDWLCRDPQKASLSLKKGIK